MRKKRIFSILILILMFLPSIVGQGSTIDAEYYSINVRTLDWQGNILPNCRVALSGLTYPSKSMYADEFINLVHDMKPGEVFLFGSLMEEEGSLPILNNNSRDIWASFLRSLFDQDVKIIFAMFNWDSYKIFEDLFTLYNYTDVTYGENYVISEYLPGREAAARAHASDPQQGSQHNIERIKEKIGYWKTPTITHQPLAS